MMCYYLNVHFKDQRVKIDEGVIAKKYVKIIYVVL